MRRLLASLALVASTALLPTAGLLATAPAAHADVQQCISRAVQGGAPLDIAQEACAAAEDGDLATCTQILSEFVPGSVARAACRLAPMD